MEAQKRISLVRVRAQDHPKLQELRRLSDVIRTEKQREDKQEEERKERAVRELARA